MLINVGNSGALLTHECGYPTVCKDIALSSPSSNKQLLIHSASAYNASGAAVDVGVGVRYAPISWKLYQVQATNVDVTASVQAGSAVSILPTTNNYGYLVQCKGRFSLLSLTISQAETGSPIYAYQYWNGSGWATLTTRNTISYAATSSIGVAFLPPVDWVPGCGSAVPDLNGAFVGYCIRVIGTTAPTAAVQVNEFSVSRFWAYSNLQTKTRLNVEFSMHPKLLEAGEGIQAFFASAGTLNSVEASYQVNG